MQPFLATPMVNSSPMLAMVKSDDAMVQGSTSGFLETVDNENRKTWIIHADHAALGAALLVEKHATLMSDSSSLPPASFVQASSWVNVIKNKKALTKYDLKVWMRDGVSTVKVPAYIFTDPSPPYVAKIHAIVNKIWALGDKSQMIDVFVINKNSMKFRINNPNTKSRILRRGMRNLAGIPE